MLALAILFKQYDDLPIIDQIDFLTVLSDNWFVLKDTLLLLSNNPATSL